MVGKEDNHKEGLEDEARGNKIYSALTKLASKKSTIDAKVGDPRGDKGSPDFKQLFKSLSQKKLKFKIEPLAGL